MPLTRVCVWDEKIGYRHVTAEEAAQMYPRRGISARSGHFVCELCAQNVCFTAPGTNTRHFRHDSAAQNKDCEERAQVYASAISSLNSHPMPIKIRVHPSGFTLQLGFFSLANASSNCPHCKKIKIAGDSHQLFEYSFERIESYGITYLDIGNLPSLRYSLVYEQPSTNLSRYWPDTTVGINPKGSFFECASGRMIHVGGKASSGRDYYLLQRGSLAQYDIPSGIDAQKITEVKTTLGRTWCLYKVRVHGFTSRIARFFLQRSVFLTEAPTDFHPIWPPYVEDPYFIYHSEPVLFFHMRGEQAELKTYPITDSYLGPQSQNVSDGKLYKVPATSKEQLLSVGPSGSVGFSYLLKKELNMVGSAPEVCITDTNGNVLDQELYSLLPKSKRITIAAPFDGKVVWLKGGRTHEAIWISADKNITIDNLSFNSDIQVFQGCDCVRRIRFEKENLNTSTSDEDAALVSRLRVCSGQTVKVSHSIGSIATKLANYPNTKEWIYTVIRQGEIPRSAYRILIEYIATL